MTYISITILTNIFLLLSFNKIKKLIPLNDKPDKKLKIHKQNVPLLGEYLYFLIISFCLFYL